MFLFQKATSKPANIQVFFFFPALMGGKNHTSKKFLNENYSLILLPLGLGQTKSTDNQITAKP